MRAERGGDRGKEMLAGVGVSEEGTRLGVERWVVGADSIEEGNPLRRGKSAAFVDDSIQAIPPPGSLGREIRRSIHRSCNALRRDRFREGNFTTVSTRRPAGKFLPPPLAGANVVRPATRGHEAIWCLSPAETPSAVVTFCRGAESLTRRGAR